MRPNRIVDSATFRSLYLLESPIELERLAWWSVLTCSTQGGATFNLLRRCIGRISTRRLNRMELSPAYLKIVAKYHQTDLQIPTSCNIFPVNVPLLAVSTYKYIFPKLCDIFSVSGVFEWRQSRQNKWWIYYLSVVSVQRYRADEYKRKATNCFFRSLVTVRNRLASASSVVDSDF